MHNLDLNRFDLNWFEDGRIGLTIWLMVAGESGVSLIGVHKVRALSVYGSGTRSLYTNIDSTTFHWSLTLQSRPFPGYSELGLATRKPSGEV